jgi:hypothetical protein
MIQRQLQTAFTTAIDNFICTHHARTKQRSEDTLHQIQATHEHETEQQQLHSNQATKYLDPS